MLRGKARVYPVEPCVVEIGAPKTQETLVINVGRGEDEV